METIDYLHTVPLFLKLNDATLALLATLAKPMQYAPGERIVAQNDLCNRFFIIQDGLVNLQTTDKDGFEASIGVLPAPSPSESVPPSRFFGEQMFTTQEPYAFHVDAVRPTQVLMITRQDFDALFNANPLFANGLTFVKDAEKKRTRGFHWVETGETVALVARKHWWVLLPGLIPIVVIAVLGGIVALVLNFIASDLILPVLGIAGVLALLVLLWVLYDWLNDEYIVTNRRIAHVERVFFTLELRENIPVDKVVGVTVNRKPPSSYLGNSTVVVQTAGREEGNVTFADVANGHAISKLINAQQDRVRARTAAEERMHAREKIKNELRQYLLPETIERPQVVPKPLPRKTLWRTINNWIRDAFVLEIHENNRVVWRKHWLALFGQSWRWFLALVGLDIVALVFAFTPSIQFPGYWLGGFMALGIFLFGMWWEWEDWRNDIYAVTDTQIIDSERLPLGLFEKSTVSMLDQVQDIKVDMPSWLSFIFDFGDVKIETAGKGGQMLFHRIHNPRGAQDEIFKRIQKYKQSALEKESALRRRLLLDALVAYDELKREQNDRDQNNNAGPSDATKSSASSTSQPMAPPVPPPAPAKKRSFMDMFRLGRRRPQKSG